MARMTLDAESLLVALVVLLLTAEATEARVANSSVLRDSAISPFIVGGDDAVPTQFPELVSIQVGYDEFQHLCGGFIIDQSWILTAGHCLEQVDPAAISILAGATDISAPGPDAVRVSIGGYEIHEDYDPDHGVSLGHDIALINLAEPIPLSEYIQVASLQNVPPKDGDEATVAGWGQVKNSDPPVATSKLQWTSLNIIDKDQCQDSLKDFATLRDDQICAKSVEDGQHAECRGDSGGALFAEGLVIGIVSWSRKPCGEYPGVFASIPVHYDWIRDKTGLDSL